MGLILDSNVLIAAERRGDAVQQVILRVRANFGNQECAVSAISIIEIAHGIYRAKTSAIGERRRVFVEDVCRDLKVIPVTLEIAQQAGKIEGEQANRRPKASASRLKT